MSFWFCFLHFWIRLPLFLCDNNESDEIYQRYYHNQNQFEKSNYAQPIHCPAECYENANARNMKALPPPQPTISLGECPCVKAPGSNNCISYDPRLQAATIDEALYTFPDLSGYKNGNKPLVTESETPSLAASGPQFRGRVGAAAKFAASKSATSEAETYTCNSPQCQSCKLMILNGFAKDERADVNEINTAKQSLFRGIDQSLCLGERSNDNAKQKSKKAARSESLSKEQIKQIAGILQTKTRRRRQTNETNELGITTRIGCDYKKGDEIASGWTGLCNLCWQWRKLPSEYFPSLLNEVACDSSDIGCLADFGTCRPVYRAVNVLKNVGTQENPTWEQHSINSISACECQIELGTPLSSLVVQ